MCRCVVGWAAVVVFFFFLARGAPHLPEDGRSEMETTGCQRDITENEDLHLPKIPEALTLNL